MTVNSRKVFEFLKANGVGVKFSVTDIQKALDFSTPAPVIGSLRGFVKKNYVEKTTENRVVNGENKEVPVYWLTSTGATINSND